MQDYKINNSLRIKMNFVKSSVHNWHTVQLYGKSSLFIYVWCCEIALQSTLVNLESKGTWKASYLSLHYRKYTLQLKAPEIVAILKIGGPKREMGGGCREHCYIKKAAIVGHNGRLTSSCNFFSFWLVKPWGTTN